MTLFFPQVQAAQAALAEVHAEAAEAAAAAEARLAAAAELAAGQQQQLQQRVFELQGEVDSLRAQLQQNQVCFFWGGGDASSSFAFTPDCRMCVSSPVIIKLLGAWATQHAWC